MIRDPHTRGDEPGIKKRDGNAVAVIPTRVGMNSEMLTQLTNLFRDPHTRGDEPVGKLNCMKIWSLT